MTPDQQILFDELNARIRSKRETHTFITSSGVQSLDSLRNCSIQQLLQLLYDFFSALAPIPCRSYKHLSRCLLEMAGFDSKVHLNRSNDPKHRVNAAFRKQHRRRSIIGAILGADQVQFAEHLLSLHKVQRHRPYEVRAVCVVLRDNGLTDMQQLRNMDGATIDDMCQQAGDRYTWHPTTTKRACATIRCICQHPEIDTDSTFRRWAYSVKRSVVFSFPEYVAREFTIEGIHALVAIPDEKSRQTMAAMIFVVYLHRLKRRSGTRTRAIRSTCCTFARTIHSMLRLCKLDGSTIISMLNGASSYHEAVEVVARLVAHRNAYGSCRQILPCDSTVNVDDDRGSHHYFKCINACIRAGCLMSVNSDAKPIAWQHIYPRMVDLEMINPEWYRSLAPPVQMVAGKRRLDDAAVCQLLGAAKNHEERMYLHLANYTGLRSEAIENLRVDQVWDWKAGQPRLTFGVLEKNSRVRRIKMSGDHPILIQYRSELASYMNLEHPGAEYLYLLPCRGRPSQTRPRACQGILQKMSKRLGLAATAYNHHQFRHNLVARHMSQPGARIEVVQRFLDHQSADVTMHRYWNTGACLDIMADAAGNSSAEQIENLQKALKERDKQIADLLSR